jgi:hypothetical protein
MSHKFLDHYRTSAQYDSAGYHFGDENYFRLYDSSRQVLTKNEGRFVVTSVLVDEWRFNKIKPFTQRNGDSVFLSYRIVRTRNSSGSVDPLLIYYRIPVDTGRRFTFTFGYSDTVFHCLPAAANRGCCASPGRL